MTLYTRQLINHSVKHDQFIRLHVDFLPCDVLHTQHRIRSEKREFDRRFGYLQSKPEVVTCEALIQDLDHPGGGGVVTVDPQHRPQIRQPLRHKGMLRPVLPVIVKVRGVTEGMAQTAVGRKLAIVIRNSIMLGEHRLPDVDDAPGVALNGQGAPNRGTLRENRAT